MNKYNVTEFLKINPRNITKLSKPSKKKKIKGSGSGLDFFFYL